jgi:uncharacterized paraquat-inducible protein A
MHEDPSPQQSCDNTGDEAAIHCPICRVPGVEKRQKWYCPRCGQLLQTCCD